MSVYTTNQHRGVIMIVVVFAVATAASALIKQPEELLGTKGFTLLAIGLSTTVAIVANKQITKIAKNIEYSLKKKVFTRREILKFYGLKNLEVSTDTVIAQTTSGKRLSFAILRVLPFPFPFQNLPENIKATYYDGWLRTIQGIDFKCYFRVSSRRFDITNFKESMQKKVKSVQNPEARRRLTEIIEEVEDTSSKSHEKRFLIIIPSQAKPKELDRDLKGKVNAISSLFNVNLGLECTRISGSELVNEIRNALNPSVKDNFTEGTLEDNSFFEVEKLAVERNRIVTTSGSGYTVQRYLKVNSYPAELNFDWMPRMLDIVNQSYEITIELQPLELFKAKQTLDSEIRTLKVEAKALELSKKMPPQSMLETIDHLIGIQSSIVSGREKPYRLSTYFRIYSTSADEKKASEESKRLQSILRGVVEGNGFTITRAGPDSLVQVARKCFSIPTLTVMDDDRITLSSYVAKIFPFGCSSFLSSELSARGVWLGWVLPSYQPFILDLETQLSYGIFVLGAPGGGKSTFIKTLAVRSNDLGEGIIIIDPSGEYVEYAKQNGVVLTFGYDRKGYGITSMNLLALYGIPLPERVRQLKELLATIFKLSDFSEICLREAIIKTYAEKGIYLDDPASWSREPPTTSDVLSVIIQNKLECKRNNDTVNKAVWESLETRIKDLTRQGAYPFFDGEGGFDVDILKNKIVCLDLKPLESDYARRLVGLVLIQIVKGQLGRIPSRTNFVIDEAHLFFDAAVLLQLVKASRKFGMGVWIATQDLADIKEEQRSLLNDIAVKVLFRIDLTAAGEVSRTFRLPKYLTEEILKFRRGEALVKLTNLPTWLHVKIKAEQITNQTEPEKPEEVEVQRPAAPKKRITVSRLTGGNRIYEFGPEEVNPRHEAIVSEVCRFLEEKGIKYRRSKTVEPDIVLTVNSQKIAVEVETGTHPASKVQEKINRLNRHFSLLLIFVDSPTKYRYSRQLMLSSDASLVNRGEFVREIRRLKEVRR